MIFPGQPFKIKKLKLYLVNTFVTFIAIGNMDPIYAMLKVQYVVCYNNQYIYFTQSYEQATTKHETWKTYQVYVGAVPVPNFLQEKTVEIVTDMSEYLPTLDKSFTLLSTV